MKQPSRTHIYKQFSYAPKWLVDFAIDYADTHRNRDYVHLFVQYGLELLEHSTKEL